MSRSALERLLGGLPPPGAGASTLYLVPDATRASLASRLTGILPVESVGAVADLAAESETGAVLLWDQPQGHLVLPPFPVREDAAYPGWNVDPLRALLAQEPLIGVLLLRLGRYAVGVYRGSSLVASKTGTRYVKGRHHAGGTSQQRFVRIREKQVAELFKAACGVLQQRFTPYAGRLEHVFLGGERLTLQAFRHGCPYLESLAPRLRRRILNVGEPSLKALESLPREIWTSLVYDVG
jgi:hypothetical protein